jgi:hypothetical protein
MDSRERKRWMLISPLHDHLDLMLAFRPWDEIAVNGLAVYGDRAHTLLTTARD